MLSENLTHNLTNPLNLSGLGLTPRLTLGKLMVFNLEFLWFFSAHSLIVTAALIHLFSSALLSVHILLHFASTEHPERTPLL